MLLAIALALRCGRLHRRQGRAAAWRDRARRPAALPPGMTAAQGAAYCSKLGQTYAEYVGSVGGYLGGNFRGGAAADLDARVAIANCQDGNYAAGIPVLQEKLRDNKVPVPPPPTG